jgi:hypothetical protein
VKVAPSTFFQGAHEFAPFALCRRGLDDFEFRGETLVNIVVVLDVIAYMENSIFGRHFVF